MKRKIRIIVSLLLVCFVLLSSASCKKSSNAKSKTKKSSTSSYDKKISTDDSEDQFDSEDENDSITGNYGNTPYSGNGYTTNQSSSENESENFSPVSTNKWKQEEFYLSSCWPYSYSANTFEKKAKSIDLCKECGFNLVELAINCTDDVLSYCDKVGINTIAGADFMMSASMGTDKSWNESTVRNEIYKIYNHNSVIGYYAWDEVAKDSMKRARTLQDFINKYDPARLSYSCLFPSYGIINWGAPVDGGQWGDNSYYNYVKEYLDIVNPPVLSFDYYTFALDCGLNINIRDWYRDLGLYRKFSLQYNKPFWNYIGTDCMNSGGKFTNIAQTRVQLNIALAYGAKFISYYTTTKYLYDEDNFEKTDIFEDVKKENQKAMAMGRFLFDKTGTEIYHCGLKNSLENNYSEIYFLDDISKSNVIDSVVASDGMIISMFKDKNDKQYMMVVTKNLKSKSAIEIALKGEKKVSTFDTSTGKLENPTTTNMITHKFLPGDAVIFSID